MRDFIESYLIDYVDDNPDCGLSNEDIFDVSDYMWINFDLTDTYNQLETLLEQYFAKK